MAKRFIERQGHEGDRKITRVRNRFGGHSVGDPERSEDRCCRMAAKARDERRLFRQELCAASDEGDCDGLCGSSGERYCASTGAMIPAGGGVVFLDSDSGRRRVKLVFAETGKLASAHF